MCFIHSFCGSFLFIRQGKYFKGGKKILIFRGALGNPIMFLRNCTSNFIKKVRLEGGELNICCYRQFPSTLHNHLTFPIVNQCCSGIYNNSIKLKLLSCEDIITSFFVFIVTWLSCNLSKKWRWNVLIVCSNTKSTIDDDLMLYWVYFSRVIFKDIS